MTAIVPDRIQTKKALIAHLKEGKELRIEDPTPWGSRTYVLNAKDSAGNTVHLLDGQKVIPPLNLYCTNHPKRSWFAEIQVQKDGRLKVS